MEGGGGEQSITESCQTFGNTSFHSFVNKYIF